jgi:hypothetical protein
MVSADGSHLDLGPLTVPRGRGRPRGSKNKTVPAAVGSSSSDPAKHRPGRPPGSKNKPKVTGGETILKTWNRVDSPHATPFCVIYFYATSFEQIAHMRRLHGKELPTCDNP